MLEILIADLTEPRLWLLVLVVTMLGLAEKLAIYHADQRSADVDLSDTLGITNERRDRLETLLHTKGAYVLLLASIAGIGAAATAVACSVGTAIAKFIFWFTISNLIRNWLIIILSGQLAILI